MKMPLICKTTKLETNSFPCEKLCTRSRFETEGKETRKWPMVFRIIQGILIIHVSRSFNCCVEKELLSQTKKYSVECNNKRAFAHTAVKRGAGAQFPLKPSLVLKIFAFKPKVKTVAEKLSYILRV